MNLGEIITQSNKSILYFLGGRKEGDDLLFLILRLPYSNTLEVGVCPNSTTFLLDKLTVEID